MGRKRIKNSYVVVNAFFSEDSSNFKFAKAKNLVVYKNILCSSVNETKHSLEFSGFNKVNLFPISINLLRSNCVILVEQRYAKLLNRYKSALRDIDDKVRIVFVKIKFDDGGY